MYICSLLGTPLCHPYCVGRYIDKYWQILTKYWPTLQKNISFWQKHTFWFRYLLGRFVGVFKCFKLRCLFGNCKTTYGKIQTYYSNKMGFLFRVSLHHSFWVYPIYQCKLGRVSTQNIVGDFVCGSRYNLFNLSI